MLNMTKMSLVSDVVHIEVAFSREMVHWYEVSKWQTEVRGSFRNSSKVSFRDLKGVTTFIHN